MSRTSVEDRGSGKQLLERNRRDVLLDSLRNIVITRTTAYILAIEVVFLGTGFAIDATTGPYDETTTAVPLILAGVFGVFAIILGSVYILSLIVRAVIAVVRVYTAEF